MTSNYLFIVYRVEGDATHVHKSKHCFYRIYLPDNTSSWLIGSQESSFLSFFNSFKPFLSRKKAQAIVNVLPWRTRRCEQVQFKLFIQNLSELNNYYESQVRDLHVSLILRGSRAQTEGHNKFNFHFRTLISYTLVCLLNVLRVRNHALSNPPQLLLQQQIIPTKPTMVGRFPLIGIVNQLFPYGWRRLTRLDRNATWRFF